MSVYAENNCTTEFLTMKNQNATGKWNLKNGKNEKIEKNGKNEKN